jgi:hypothetical protein
MNLREGEAGGRLDAQFSSELSSSVRILDLLKLNSSEADELRKQIEIQGGHVDVLVHPYYPSYAESFNKSIAIYYQQRDRFIENSLIAEKPLILFEEENRLDERKLQLFHDFKNGKLYVVTTYQDAPTPVLPEREVLALGKKAMATDKASWDYLENVLKGIGVNHIGIGGMQLIIAHGNRSEGPEQGVAVGKQPSVNGWLKEDKTPLGCVGFAAKELAKRGFDVSFSPITSPSKWEKH